MIKNRNALTFVTKVHENNGEMAMTDMWDQWKKGFFAWENTTANYFEEVLKNPVVLGPAGQILGGAMKARAAGEQALAQFWGGWGLPTKRDQERTLHALNQIQSTLLDLEERLAAIEAKKAAPADESED
jgi:hypothetical protein